MQDDSPENGVKTIWLNQPTEKPIMISKLIEQRSRTLRAKTRRGLIGTVAGPLAAGFFYAERDPGQVNHIAILVNSHAEKAGYLGGDTGCQQLQWHRETIVNNHRQRNHRDQ